MSSTVNKTLRFDCIEGQDVETTDARFQQLNVGSFATSPTHNGPDKET